MPFQPQEWGLATPNQSLLESETESHELSVEFVFDVLVSSTVGFLSLPLCWVFLVFSFHCGSSHQVGLLLCSASASRSRAEVVSAKLNPGNGTIYVRGVYNLLGSVLLQQKFEAMDGPVLQLRVTAQFYLTSKGSYILEVRGLATKKTQREEKPPAQFWLLFLYASSPPPEPALCKLDSQEGCLFSLRFSLLSSDLPLFCFCWLLPSLSFSHHHYGLFFPILTT